MDDATAAANQRARNRRLTTVDALLAPPPAPEQRVCEVPVIWIARKAGIPSTCDPLEVEFAEVHIAEQLHKASPRVRAAAWVLRALPPILIVVALAAKEWLAGRLDEPISWALLLYSALLAAYWPILLWQTRPKPKRRPNAPRPSRVRDPVFEAWLAEQAAARAR